MGWKVKRRVREVGARRGSLFLFVSAAGKGVPGFYLFYLRMFAC